MTAVQPPLVSVIVPVRNGERTIRDCLVSVLQTDYPPDRREVLVVDNASTDRTASIVTDLPVRYLCEGRRGPAAARNAGIVASRGEIVAFTDADCVASKTWLRVMVSAFDEEGVGGVAGEIVSFPPETPAERYAARVRHLSPQKYLGRPHLPFAVFANLAFRRTVFDRIGLLDETLGTGESTDFCTRFLRKTDLMLLHAPKAVVFHRHRQTTWGFLSQQWAYGRGHAGLYIKYGHEIPWSWGKSLAANRELAMAALRLAGCGLRSAVRRDAKQDREMAYFGFLKKLAERLGFIRERAARLYGRRRGPGRCSQSA